MERSRKPEIGCKNVRGQSKCKYVPKRTDKRNRRGYYEGSWEKQKGRNEKQGPSFSLNHAVYVDYYGDGYHLYNRRYPSDRIAIGFYLN